VGRRILLAGNKVNKDMSAQTAIAADQAAEQAILEEASQARLRNTMRVQRIKRQIEK